MDQRKEGSHTNDTRARRMHREEPLSVGRRGGRTMEEFSTKYLPCKGRGKIDATMQKRACERHGRGSKEALVSTDSLNESRT